MLKKLYLNAKKEYYQKIQNNMPLLIEAFTQFYGETYREYITYTLNHMSIYFILNQDYFIPKTYKSSIEAYHNYLNRYLKTKKLPQSKKVSFLINSLTFSNVSPDTSLYLALMDYIFNNVESLMFVDKENNPTFKSILLPVFGTSDLTLIHELNHVLSTNIIGMDANNSELIYTDVFPEEETMELFNEQTAFEIFLIFRKMGGNITNIPIYESLYMPKLHLIKPFYDTFKSLIKEALISGNNNLIENKLGPEYFKKYNLLIKRLSAKNKISNKDILRLEFLRKVMFEHSKKEHDYNYEVLYETLIKSNHHLKFLK